MAGTARAHGTQVVLQNSTRTSRPVADRRSQSSPSTLLTTKFGTRWPAGPRADGGCVSAGRTGGGAGAADGGGRMAAVGGGVGVPAMFSRRNGDPGGSSGGGPGIGGSAGPRASAPRSNGPRPAGGGSGGVTDDTRSSLSSIRRFGAGGLTCISPATFRPST